MALSTLNDPRYDVFETEAVDRETSTSWEQIKTPLESLENKGDIRFRLEPRDVDWMDLYHGEIDFEVRIVKKDGKPLQAADIMDATGAKVVTPKDECTLINNAAHSIFKDLRVRVNESLIAGGDANYSHIAFMANQYQYSHSVKATLKADEGYYSPEYNGSKGKEFDDLEHPTNEALTKAYQGSKWVSLVLPLNAIPVINQNKAIPPARKFELELVRNEPEFCIWAKKKTPAETYDYQIRNMKLRVPMLRPSVAIQHQIASKLTTSKMVYSYVDLNLYRHTITAHQVENELYNIFHNKDVKLAFFVLMPSKIYNDQNRRKYIFKRHDLETIDLRSEGRSVAGEPVNAKNIARAYHQMNKALGLNERNEDIGITRDDFQRYANVYVFDCTPGKQYEQRQDGRSREYNLYLKFESALTKNLDVFCYFTEDKQFNFQPGNLVVPNDYAEVA